MREPTKSRAGLLSAVIGLLVVGSAPPTTAVTGPMRDYLVYVVCEGADKIALVGYGPRGARLEKEIATGIMASDLDGPHGIVVAPARDYYYVSLGHGRPFGTVLKYSTSNDEVTGRVTLGHFPASMDISRDGNFLFVVNFNLHGDMKPSSVSVVATELMLEVARTETCTMPHGSRVAVSGLRQYSVCMMDDILTELDTRTFRVSRHLVLTRGRERGASGPPCSDPAGAHSTHRRMDHGSEPGKPGDPTCSPTWAQPSANGESVFVACNQSDEIVEVDSRAWKVKRRIPSRPGVYNLAVTTDGKLVATNKRDQSVSIYDLRSGRELVRLPTRRRVVHGAVISPDNHYAFVSVEGVGSEPGTVEIIDLGTLKTVATVDVAPQAAGIDFFKSVPAR
jgi:DNA-binding beta-propeller fold protein YncE